MEDRRDKVTPKVINFNKLNIISKFILLKRSVLETHFCSISITSKNKTNVFAFKDQNELQKIWSFSKYRDQKKSNKTRLLLNKLSRFLSFQTNKEQPIAV